ncbi:dTDP-glucose 4,6-dehydratase [Streptomyces avicenniae]|uniref:dTDP-glucose 4,6-dehydratase n=1 Tax=Streptomyces avicenniae TaxID=500153 RepID=UPI00069C2731|nr:dTDP-glucose 4,6-dehydratase [Streptomyces avicenniae]
MQHVLVTGGAGFIGSHFVKRLLRSDTEARVTVLDALTYAGATANLGDAFLATRLAFVQGDIRDVPLVDRLAADAEAIVHFAAETHVDRSIAQASTFMDTNVMGTQVLLEAARRHQVSRFVHVSTDEVYGPLPTGTADEHAPLRPTVPYAASKAASDLMALSYWRTYGLGVCVTRSSNNYGPNQHPEKLIPGFITTLLRGGRVTVHGEGQHIRNWLHVEDNCAGIESVLRHGTPGGIYNIGGGTDLTTREITARLLEVCGLGWDRVTYVPDRPSNDIRYSMDWSATAALGYCPAWGLEDGLARTVAWYRQNPDRWAPLLRATTPSLPHSALSEAA